MSMQRIVSRRQEIRTTAYQGTCQWNFKSEMIRLHTIVDSPNSHIPASTVKKCRSLVIIHLWKGGRARHTVGIDDKPYGSDISIDEKHDFRNTPFRIPDNIDLKRVIWAEVRAWFRKGQLTSLSKRSKWS